MGGPNGGSGGRGGSVYLRCSEGLNTLAAVRHKVHHRATDGQKGQGKSRTGTSGTEVFIPSPIGTVVRDQVRDLSADKLLCRVQDHPRSPALPRAFSPQQFGSVLQFQLEIWHAGLRYLNPV